MNFKLESNYLNTGTEDKNNRNKENKQTTIWQDINIFIHKYISLKNLGKVAISILILFIILRNLNEMAFIKEIDEGFGFSKIAILSKFLGEQLHFTTLIAGFLIIIIYIVTMYFILKPRKYDKIEQILKDLKITDNGKDTGNTPILIKDSPMKKNNNTRISEFYGNGVIAEDFKKEQGLEKISSKLSNFVVDAEDKGTNKVLMYYKKHKSSEMLFWKKEYLSNEDFEIVLGEKETTGQEKINFNIIPHMIIASGTGAGKTTLFKSVLMQSYLKGAKIIIADFKGGLDFNKGWKELDKSRCEVITTADSLFGILKYNIEDEEKEREYLLNKYKCKDIGEYNYKIDCGEIKEEKMQRIIIGLDEAAQVFNQTKNKEKEETLQEIRNKIEEIAELDRAKGIHLIISTQVPSAKIFSDRIRYNVDYRVCGRANEILSKMVIDRTDATKISKNARGKFVNNEGTFFQGYLFNEKDVFEELKQKESNNNEYTSDN